MSVQFDIVRGMAASLYKAARDFAQGGLVAVIGRPPEKIKPALRRVLVF